MEERILIVDDEKEIADLLEIYCVNENYTVYKFYSPVDALSCLQREPIDLAVIDVMMPEMSGFTLCRRIREQYYFPVIMLTAKVEDADKIAGLTMGADDYVTKPFHPPELMARIKTQLRRYKKYNAQTPMKQEIEYDFRGLCVNRQKHRRRLGGADRHHHQRNSQPPRRADSAHFGIKQGTQTNACVPLFLLMKWLQRVRNAAYFRSRIPQSL